MSGTLRPSPVSPPRAPSESPGSQSHGSQRSSARRRKLPSAGFAASPPRAESREEQLPPPAAPAAAPAAAAAPPPSHRIVQNRSPVQRAPPPRAAPSQAAAAVLCPPCDAPWETASPLDAPRGFVDPRATRVFSAFVDGAAAAACFRDIVCAAPCYFVGIVETAPEGEAGAPSRCVLFVSWDDILCVSEAGGVERRVPVCSVRSVESPAPARVRICAAAAGDRPDHPQGDDAAPQDRALVLDFVADPRDPAASPDDAGDCVAALRRLCAARGVVRSGAAAVPATRAADA